MRSVELPYAKSLANRQLVLRAVRNEPLPLPDARWSGDMNAMLRVLQAPVGADGVRRADAGPAGTAYRFGMAYWAAQPGANVLLLAEERLRERPIAPLVAALRSMGGQLEPDPSGWRIQGTLLRGGIASVDARLSSQFASAVQLISTCCSAPVKLELPLGVASAPYLAMTQALIEGSAPTWPPERDWSAALVFLAAVGLSGIPIRLEGLRGSSLQGDARSAHWGAELGFSVTSIGDECLEVHPAPWTREAWNPDFSDTPDLAMPAVVAAALGGRPGRATGLHTLNTKESPRLDATVAFLSALGCGVRHGSDWIEWTPGAAPTAGRVVLDSLQDHRMAFCAALASLRYPVQLTGAEAVAKSFPDFWGQFRAAFGAEPLPGRTAH